MADGSIVEVLYDGSDITNNVIAVPTKFDSQIAAQPGTFEMTIRDPDKVLSFVTGKEITVIIDGISMYSGYVTQVTRKFALPVDDTSQPVETRQWVLRGVDYNILLDKRVLRNTANYLEHFPAYTVQTYDGQIVRDLANYIDIPAGFDVTTNVDDVAIVNPDSEAWALMQQGSTWRQQLSNIAEHSGAVHYFDADKNLIWRSLENSEAKWGFSDVPNKRPLTVTPVTFQGATYGFRDMDAVEDGSFIINDAFVWGGNKFSGPAGSVLFSRYEAADSIAEHGRWQLSETRFGESNYASQTLVDQRARVIVNGHPTELQPGTAEGDSRRGLRFSQWQVRLSWFGHDVPRIAGVPQHLRPGDLTTLIFYVLGTDEDHPLILHLPLRQIRISFPTLKEDGTGYVRFDGFWSLQLTDPYTLWSYLLAKQTVGTRAYSTSDLNSTTTTYGSFGQFEPQPAPNGTETVFDLPNNIGYLANTTQVYVNGILQTKDTHYTESDPDAGEITFLGAPQADDQLWIICRTTGT